MSAKKKYFKRKLSIQTYTVHITKNVMTESFCHFCNSLKSTIFKLYTKVWLFLRYTFYFE